MISSLNPHSGTALSAPACRAHVDARVADYAQPAKQLQGSGHVGTTTEPTDAYARQSNVVREHLPLA